MDPFSFATIIHHLAVADFPPVEVQAFPGPGGHARAGGGACGLQFQFFDPRTSSFVDYFMETGAAATAEEDLRLGDQFVIPPHDRSLWPHNWCGNTLPGYFVYLLDDWRVVDENDNVVMTFDGPYAVDARELQSRIGEGATYESDRRAPGCDPTPEHECWTALEIWVQLEDWKAANCHSEPL